MLLFKIQNCESHEREKIKNLVKNKYAASRNRYICRYICFQGIFILYSSEHSPFRNSFKVNMYHYTEATMYITIVCK